VQRRFASDGVANSSPAGVTDETVPEPPSQSEERIAAQSSVAQPGTSESATDGIAAEPATSPEMKTVAQGVHFTEPAAHNAYRTPRGPSQSRSTSTPFGNSSASLSDPPSPSQNLYIGNLFFEVTEDALEREFSRYGPIKKTKIIYDHRGLSKGFGYVEFETQEAADAAVEGLNQQVFEGRRLSVQYHRQRTAMPNRGPGSVKSKEPSETLFIGNMSFEMSDKDLNDLFREVRNVIDVRVAIDRRTGQPRGFAHCDFTDVESAVEAKQMLEAKEIYGRRLRIDFSHSNSNSNRGNERSDRSDRNQRGERSERRGSM